MRILDNLFYLASIATVSHVLFMAVTRITVAL